MCERPTVNRGIAYASVMGGYGKQRVVRLRAVWRGVAVCALVGWLGAGCASVDVAPMPDSLGLAQIPPSSDGGRREAGQASAADRDRKAAEVYAGTADQFLRAGDPANAEHNYRLALKLNPGLHRARLGLVKALDARGNRDTAIQTLRELLTALAGENQDRAATRVKREAEELLRVLDEVGLALSEAARFLMRKAAVAERGKRYDNARELYKHAGALWPAAGAGGAMASVQQPATEEGGVRGAGVPAHSGISIRDLTPASVEVGGGKLLVDTTRWDKPVYNQGKTFGHTLWTPAPSRLSYTLNRRFTKFTATILVSAFLGTPEQIAGLEAELRKPQCGTVHFRVHGDGKLLFDSGLVTYNSGTKDISVNVSGVNVLTLETNDANDGNALDFAIWADGRMHVR